MGKRGVTRPMAEHQLMKNQQDGHHGDGHHGDGHHGDGDHEKHYHMMSKDQRMRMLHMHYMQTLWIYWLLVILGLWMVFSPLTFDYGKGVVEPSGGRDAWLSMSQRISFMKWSDIISGLALIFFGSRSLTPNRLSVCGYPYVK